MEIRTLQYFLILADTLHFGRASQRCNLSPSALTRMIQRLEDEVGERLFDRDNRTVTLTRAGVLFREYAQRTVYGWEDFKDMIRDEDAVYGRLSIYSSVTACYTILPELFDRFRKSYPNVHINLQTGDAADALLKVMENEVDVAVTAKPEYLPDSLDYVEMTSTPFVLAVPIESFLESIDEVDWSSVPVILPDHGFARKKLDEWFRSQGINPNVYGEVSGNEAILAMVGLDCGVGIVPRLVYEKSPMKELVDILDFDEAFEPTSVGFCMQSKKRNLPIVSLFWEEVSRLNG
jgi:LysR family positive regulator for ilvC